MPSLLCTALTLNSKHVNNTRIQSSRRSPMVYQFSATANTLREQGSAFKRRWRGAGDDA